MKLTKIEEKLYDILIKQDEAVVVSIAGDWGIGKTYFWKNIFLKKYKNEIKDAKVAYISLFGIDSISDIRTSILLQTSPTKNKINRFNKKISQPLKSLKSTLKLDDVPVSFSLNSISSILSILTSGDFKDVIVCFDDFERMSSKINLKDILGLISELKEQKECKVVMILNEKELEKLSDLEQKKHSEIFNLYKEKIIDLEMKFEPTIDEIFSNGLQNIDCKFDLTLIKSIFDKFEIKNIRVIKRIINELSSFEYIIANEYNDNVIRDFLFTAISIFILKTKFGMSIDDYLEYKAKSDPFNMSDEEFGNIDLNELGKSYFNHIDESIENIILEYLKTSKIEKDYLAEILKNKNNSTKRYELKEHISNLWYKLHIDFSYTITDFSDEVLEIFKQNPHEIPNILSLDDFHHYVSFLQQNGKGMEKGFIDSTIKNFIDKFIEEEKSIDIHEEHKQDFIKEYYPYLLKYWDEEKQKKLIGEIDQEKVEELLEKVTSGWGNKDEFILNNIKPQVYKDYIEFSPSFTKSIVSFLSSKKYSDSSFSSAIRNIKEALRQLQDENDDNKFKVDKIIQTTGMSLD